MRCRWQGPTAAWQGCKRCGGADGAAGTMHALNVYGPPLALCGASDNYLSQPAERSPVSTPGSRGFQRVCCGPHQNLNVIDLLGMAAGIDGSCDALGDRGRDHWKPCPRGFERIREALGAPPAQCLYIGDNPAKDFRAPKALGWRTLGVRHPQGEHASAVAVSPLDEADATVTSLGELSVNDLLISYRYCLSAHGRVGARRIASRAETAPGRPFAGRHRRISANR